MIRKKIYQKQRNLLKRKTLIKDFDEIVKRGHEEEIKNVFKNVILMLMEVMTKQMHCLLNYLKI